MTVKFDSKSDFAVVIKLGFLKWEHCPGLSESSSNRECNVNIEQRLKFEDATMLSLKMEEKSMSQGMQEIQL